MVKEPGTESRALARELRDRDAFRGEVVTAGDDAYGAVRTGWNTAFDGYPAVVARCAATEDVVAAVRFARRRGLPIAVRSGGHSHAGHATCDDGIVIDLGAMKRVSVDGDRSVAVVGPGLTWGELNAAVEPDGLVAVGGHVSAVGVGGLVLGGGIGWFARSHGLACDNLVEARVVTATGEVVHASEADNAELLWGLRGGGGNFGIVTELTLRLHPIGPLLGGLLMYREEDTHEALRLFRDLSATAPPTVSVMAGLITAPPAPYVPAEMQGRPAVLLACCSAGPVDQGWRELAPLREVVPPAVDLLEPMTFGQLQRLFDPIVPDNLALVMRSHLLGPLEDAALDTLVEHTRVTPSPTSNVLVTPLGGAVNDIAADATAFAHRDAHFNMEIGAAMPSPDVDTEPYRQWAETCRRAMQPFSRGVQVNHLADEPADRVREAYAGNYARLARLKRAYDPDNTFHLNQNIAP